jgi:small subunit ribosomal protein S5
VLTKSIGTQNPINLVKATMQGLESLRRPEDVAKLRGISVREVLGVGNGKAAEAAETLAAKDETSAEQAGGGEQPAAAETPPAEAPAAESPPAESPPVETPPAEAS